MNRKEGYTSKTQQYPSSIYNVYINKEQYRKIVRGSRSFYLILELSKQNRKILLDVIQDCMAHDHFQGLIFVVNKNEVLLDRTFFLKDLILKLFKNGKKSGVWGIPYCSMRLIFGSFGFSQIGHHLIPDMTSQYSKYTPTFQKNSSLLLKCKECIACADCDGLGERSDNHSMWDYRTAHEYRKNGRDRLFKTENSVMQSMYDSFCKYVDHSDLTYSDRYLYFVKNIDIGSNYSFSDRFVYHCDFPAPEEYKQEIAFLARYAEDKTFLPMVHTLLNDGEIRRIGYSKAEKDNVSRESFYVNPNSEQNYYLLDYFNIDLDIQFVNKFYGVGIDFYNGRIKSYKVYFMLPTEILLQMHPAYFDKINVDMTALHQKEHYYVVRLDENKKQVSERIDLTYTDKDRLAFQFYLAQLPFTEKSLQALRIYAFAFEFEKMEISKVNMYYINRF